MKRLISYVLTFVLVLSLLAQNSIFVKAEDENVSEVVTEISDDSTEAEAAETTEDVVVEEDDVVNTEAPDSTGLMPGDYWAFAIVEENFPDPSLRAALRAKFNLSYESPWLSYFQVKKVDDLDLSGWNIGSLEGIDKFFALDTLKFNDNNVKKADLSGLKYLSTVECNSNGLEELDLKFLENLHTLKCSNNNISVLNVVLNPNIVTLDARDNNITVIELSTLEKLKELHLDNNTIKELSFVDNTKLQILTCASNNLTKLDLTNNSELYQLNCSDNNLQQVNIGASTKMFEVSDSYAYVGNQKESGTIKLLLTNEQKAIFEKDFASNPLNERVECLAHIHNYIPTKWESDYFGHWHLCDGCGARTKSVNHVPGPDATFESDQTCTVCDYVIKKKLDNCAHLTKKYHNGVSASCTEDGFRPYYYCDVCKAYIDTRDDTKLISDIEAWKKGEGKLPAGSHNWSTAVVVKEQTYEETGIREIECLNCGLKKTEDIPVYGSVSNNKLEIAKGGKVDIAAIAKKELNGKKVDQYKIISGKKYGTVSKKGMLKTTKAGTIVIVCREKTGKKSYNDLYKLTVTVTKAPMSTKISVNKSAGVYDMSKNITSLPDNQKVTWSIAPKYQSKATIDPKTGIIQIKEKGTIKVVCEIGKGGYSAKRTCTIKIKNK